MDLVGRRTVLDLVDLVELRIALGLVDLVGLRIDLEDLVEHFRTEGLVPDERLGMEHRLDLAQVGRRC